MTSNSTPPLSSNSEAPQPGGETVFPHFEETYQVLTLIHDSGMGRIYKALHTPSRRIVIIKTLREQAKEPQASSMKRFEREAKALAQFDHPNIVGILDYRLDGVNPFIAMEYIEGETLREYIDRFPQGLPFHRFFTLIEQLCDAVNLIHDHGIIHRDLKPKNMMIQRTKIGPRVKVLDFGLILFDRLAFPDGGQGLTLKSELIGAPAYMSPEQCKGDKVTHLTDIYNMGLIAFEMITGKQPFQGKSLQDMIIQQVEKQPELASHLRPEVPVGLAQAIARALDKDPENRFFSARAFWLALNKGIKKQG